MRMYGQSIGSAPSSNEERARVPASVLTVRVSAKPLGLQSMAQQLTIRPMLSIGRRSARDSLLRFLAGERLPT